MIIVVDEFYPNPDEVREQALKEFFFPGAKGKKLGFPGQRTIGSFSRNNWVYLKNRYEKLLNAKIVDFPVHSSNTAFTLGLKPENEESLKNWVHHDCAQHTEQKQTELNSRGWASVCYLSPDAKADHGTALFKSNKTGKVYKTEDHRYAIGGGFKDFWNPQQKHVLPDERFTLHSYVANVYNRLIMYPADYWHAPFNAGWGHDKETGRLVQVCFFNVDKSE